MCGRPLRPGTLLAPQVQVGCLFLGEGERELAEVFILILVILHSLQPQTGKVLKHKIIILREITEGERGRESSRRRR